MARGLRVFLDALGALSPRERERASRTAARAWAGELASGEGKDVASLVRPMRSRRGPDLVWVDGIPYASLCPHHLLPVRGMAHVAYVPDGLIAPLGDVSRLVQTAAARLIFQEDLAELIASGLERALGARGTACLLAGAHDCMQIRGARTGSAIVRVLASRGTLASGNGRRDILAHWGRAARR